MVQSRMDQARFEPSPKRVRVSFDGEFIADTRHAMLMWEPPRPVPLYYFPVADVRMDQLEPSEHRRPSVALGEARYWNVRGRHRVGANAAWGYDAPPEGAPAASGYVTFKWDQMDAWFEEDEEVFVHPRDPHHRIDVLQSSRHVEVLVRGEKVADTHRPLLLFETGLLTRYYIPKLDVRMNLLRRSDTLTRCPYKGDA